MSVLGSPVFSDLRLYHNIKNITALQRNGQTSASTYGLIDNLTYTLTGNQLNRVDDTSTASLYGTNTFFLNGASIAGEYDAVAASAYNNGFEFKDAVKQAGEYAYDANGNLTKATSTTSMLISVLS